jgi:NAD(P)-dependent dehydrogenase (short-subunit alcohol dehydrogenase family)
MSSTEMPGSPSKDGRGLFSIEGATALITGGARGIGLFVAEGFVRSGVKVYISSRDRSACEMIAGRLSQQGQCIALPADLSSIEGISGLASQLAERESGLDILINNAGVTANRPIEALSEEEWDTVMDLNLKSTFFLTRSLLPLLRAAASREHPARVVNIGSIAGTKVYDNGGYAYMASKAAVHHLTRALAVHLVSQHINVNAVAPGPMDGGMMERRIGDPILRSQIEERIPMARLGSADDMLGVVTFLCARASAYLTGTVVPLDGGASTCA